MNESCSRERQPNLGQGPEELRGQAMGGADDGVAGVRCSPTAPASRSARLGGGELHRGGAEVKLHAEVGRRSWAHSEDVVQFEGVDSGQEADLDCQSYSW